MRRKRIVNFRLPFAAALALVCGAAASYAFEFYGIDYFYLITVVPAAAVIFIVLLLLNRPAADIAQFFIVAAFAALGAAYTAIILSSYSVPPAISGASAQITGVVEEVRTTASGQPCLVLSHAYANGVGLGGKIICYLSGEAGGAVSPGYTVTLTGYVGHYDLFSFGSLDYRISDGIRYYASCQGNLQYSYGFSLFGWFRSGIYAILFDNLDFETAAVAYAMITGSTQDISSQTLSAFRYGGVAHIFAVSGLNITVLYVSVTWLLKRLRAGKWFTAVAGLLVIFVYTGICNFTLSAVRAAVMCAVACLSSLTRNKYDGLNSLSLSVIIIALINPLNLFDVGFILSVSAMLGIILLSPNINHVLRRLPTGLRSNITMSVSSQMATLPALLLTFGYISGAGLLLNIIVLPLLSFLYVFMFACVAICAVVPPAAVVLPYAALPLQAVINFFVQSGFENSLISGFGGWWIALIVFAGVAVLSDKFNFTRSFRAAAGGVCALCMVLCCTLGGVVPGGQTRIVAGGYYNGGMVIVRSQSGTALIVVCDTYAGGINSFVNTYAPEGVDDLIIIGGDGCAAYYYECGVDVKNVWLPPSEIPVGLDGAQAHYEAQFQLHGTYYAFNDSYTLTATANGVTFAVAAGDVADVGSADILFTVNGDISCPADISVCFDGEGCDYNLYVQGRLQFIAKGGKLISAG